MNIRFVRRRHQDKTVLAEFYNAPPDELPKNDEHIWFDGVQQRVLSIIKSYEVDEFTKDLYPAGTMSPLERICWFEVDIT